MNPILRIVAGVAMALGLLAPRCAWAQIPPDWDSQRIKISRAELEELLARYEQTSGSEALTSEFRARARYEVALIRTRLRDGDFQTGDQVTLQVEGEPALSDTFTVNSKRGLDLPAVGEVSLRGILRAELQTHLATLLGRFIRDPVVRATSSIRLLVDGEVGRPGFYVFDTNSLLSDALMIAGGPTTGAKLTEVRIERGTEVIWQGTALQQAIAEGRTMDQLSLRAGDHVVVPVVRPTGMSNVARLLLSGIPAVALALTTLSQIF